MQIKLICTTKILFLASFWKWQFLELEIHVAYFNKEDYHLHLLLPSKIDK